MTWYRVQQYADHIPHPLERLPLQLKNASRILMLDGKHERIKGKPYCIHIAYDTGIGVVHFAIDDSENATGYAVMLNMLAERGYRPLIVVSDGHWGIESALNGKKIPHQLCMFHAIKRLRDLLKTCGELKGADRILYSRCKGILKAKTIDIMAERVNSLRKISFCFKKQRQKQVLAWFWNILHAATMHFSFDDVPRTSNELERLNGQIEARIKTMRGIKSKKSLYNLLKVLFYFRDYK